MDLSTSANDHIYLARLEKLLAKVKQAVQSNQSNQYHSNFLTAQPKHLCNGLLHQHQIEALQWMVDLASQKSNGILADDMGLGKTVQAISYMAYLKEEHDKLGWHLVLCPKSVCHNWVQQIHKWFPSARVQLLLNTENQREQTLRKIVKPLEFDILVTTYEATKKIPYLSRIQWEVMVVDQAHKIKNCETQIFKTLSGYKASFKLLLTGTPLSNSLKQLWSLLNFIMPNLFDSCNLFNDVEKSVEQFVGNEQQKLAYQCKVANFFHQIIGPFVKRRVKKDLQLGLPPKFQKTIFVPLSKLQLRLYRNFLQFGNVLGPSEHPNFNIMNPRKICLHPYLFEGVEGEHEAAFGEHLVESCGKLKIMDKLLHKLVGEGHKVLIFSQFTILLDLLEDYCVLRNYTFCRIDGKTDMNAREKQIDQFNNTNNYSIFLLSTRAGGLGINLVSADRVIIYDIDWNPQNDLQAMDRAYRIGQTHAVHVYKLVTEYSIEERILELQKYKLIWDELVIQKGSFVGRSRQTENPFSNCNEDMFAKFGKRNIFRLQENQEDKTIEEILAIGQLKDQKLDQAIRKRLVQDLEQRGVVINPFKHMKEENMHQQYEQFKEPLSIRRIYNHQTRERKKFDRNFSLPAFKFYLQVAKIQQLQFQLYMENKRELPDLKIISSISREIKQVKAKGKFDNWIQKEFNLFLQAHRFALKEDYQEISKHIGKTWEQVREYSIHYFAKAPNNDHLRQSLHLVEGYQARLRQQMRENGIQVKQSQGAAQILGSKSKELKFKEQLKKEIEEEKEKKAEEIKKMIQKKQQQTKIKESEKIKKKDKRQEEKKLKKQQEEKQFLEQQSLRQQQAKLWQQGFQERQAQRLQRIKQTPTYEQARREMEMQRAAQIQRMRLKQLEQMSINQVEKDIVKGRTSQQSNQTSKLRGEGNVVNSDNRQTMPKLETSKANGKDMRFL